MKERNPYGDAAARSQAESGEREWQAGFNENVEAAAEQLQASLDQYPDFMNIPAAELEELVTQAEIYLEQDLDQADRKIAQRARDILSTPEAAELVKK